MRSIYPLGTLILASFLIGCGPESNTSPSEISMTQIESRLSAIEANLSADNSTSSTSTPTVPGESIQSITVQPPAFALTVGQINKIELVTLSTASGDKKVLTGFDVLDLKMSDESVASINAQGEITGLKAGTTILEISLGDNKQSLPVVISAATPSPTPTPVATATPVPSATPTPTPTPTPSPSSNIKKVSIAPEPLLFKENETKVISIFLTLDNGENEDLVGALQNITLAELSSSDSSVATISSSGVITAVSVGTATIKAVYKGIEGTASVTVEEDDD